MDDEGRPNRIQWYFAEPGAEIYEGKHVFSPRIDNLSDDPTGLYEFTALRTNERRYNAGRNLWGALGTHVDGDAEDFRGLAPRSKYWIAGQPATNPCGLIQHFAEGIQFGTRERNAQIVTRNYVELASVSIMPVYYNVNGFEMYFRCTLGFPQGIEFASVAKLAARFVDRVEFANVARGVAPWTQHEAAFIEFAGVARGVAPWTQHEAAFIEFAGVARTVAPWTQHEAAFIEFAGVVRAVGQWAGHEKAYVEYAGPICPPPAAFADYLEFASIERDETTTPPPEPGSSCETALLLEPGVELQYSLPGGTGVHHWFKFNMLNGVTYHVNWEASGSFPNAYVNKGRTCASKTLLDYFYFEGPTCMTIASVPHSLDWVFIDVICWGADTSYTISYDTGACP